MDPWQEDPGTGMIPVMSVMKEKQELESYLSRAVRPGSNARNIAEKTRHLQECAQMIEMLRGAMRQTRGSGQETRIGN
jgi:uncharacterized membrane protein